MSLIINAQNVSKKYGGLTALNNFNIEIPKGSSFALLGPNGAGKTTFVKLLLGLIRLNGGDLTINDQNVNDFNARSSLAYLPEKFNFFPYYTALQVVCFFGSMRGVASDKLTEQAYECLGRLNISDLAKKKFSNLSKGQRQRVGIAALLIGNSELLILDEPFSGLDPIAIKDLKELLKELKGQGKTLFINSHILSEMEQVCDSFAILNKGECLFSGSMSEVPSEESLEDFFYRHIKQDSKDV